MCCTVNLIQGSNKEWLYHQLNYLMLMFAPSVFRVRYLCLSATGLRLRMRSVVRIASLWDHIGSEKRIIYLLAIQEFILWEICHSLPRYHYLNFVLLPSLLTFHIRLLFFFFSALYFRLVRSSSETMLIVWTRVWKLLENKISVALWETSMCFNILYYLDVSFLDMSCLISSVTEEYTDISAFEKWKVWEKGDESSCNVHCI